MEEFKQSKKEINSIILFAFLSVLLVIGISGLSLYQLRTMHTFTADIYKYPLQVTQVAQNIQIDIYKMHRTMHQIVKHSLDKPLQLLQKEIEGLEENIEHNIHTIEDSMESKEGLALLHETRERFIASKSLRQEVIALVIDQRGVEAIESVQKRGAVRIKELETSVTALLQYTQNNAELLQSRSYEMSKTFKKINLFIVILFLLLFSYLMYYTMKKIKNYIHKHKALKELSDNIIDSVDNLLFVKDENFVYITCNKVFAKFTGFKQEDIIGKSDYDLFDQKTADFFRQKDREMLTAKQARSNFEWVDDADGKPLYLLTVKSPLIDSAGDIIGLVGNSANLTEQKKAEMALKQSEEQLELAINGTQAGLWDWNLITNTVYYAPLWKSMLGYKDHELVNKFETWRNLVHPDELDQTEQKIAEVISHSQKMFDVTFRMKHKEGHWVWILSRGQVICDESGKPVRMIGFHTDISKQQQMLEELHKSEAKFHSLFHNSPDMHMSVSAKDATVLICNNTLLKTLGYTKEEVIGRSVFDLYHEESLEAVKDAFKTFIKTGIVTNRALIVKRKDGTKIDITLNANAVRDEEGNILHSIGIWRDITELKAAEEALKSSIARIQSIFRTAPIGIGFLSDRTFQEVNEKFCHMTGYAKEELIGQNTRMLYQDDETYKLAGEDGPKLARKYGTGTIETQFLCKDGTVIDVLVSGTPLDPNDHSLGVTMTFLDITEEKKKDELMRVQARHAAMGEMIGMIAHQWRQPLTVISMDANNMLVDIALENFGAEKATAVTNNILAQTQNLSKTIDDFRNFFKPDKSLSQVKLQDVIEETYAMIKESFANHKIQFETSYDTNATVDVYPRELMQVFVNLFNNAKDVLVSNKIDPAWIKVKIYEDALYVVTEICDNGGGIDAHILPKVFEPYFTTKDEKTGTGLGLYMSKMIIETHLRGTIEVYNNDNGACFRIKLLKRSDKAAGGACDD